MAPPRVPLLDRLPDKVEVGDCWEWTAGQARGGYGKVWLDGRTVVAHVAVWEALVGPVPDGLELDHLCRNRLCVNPDHLEPVTRAENVRRGANGRRQRCPRGHVYSGRNVNGARICHTCARDQMRRYRAERKGRTCQA